MGVEFDEAIENLVGNGHCIEIGDIGGTKLAGSFPKGLR